MARELRFQILGADEFDHSIAPIAQSCPELAVVIGLCRLSVSGPIDEDTDPGHTLAGVVEVDLDGEV